LCLQGITAFKASGALLVLVGDGNARKHYGIGAEDIGAL
jgi:hypothetical protein